MPVNNHNGLRRAASVGLLFSWIAVALTLAGGVLPLVGGFDTNVGRTTILVRYSDAHSPLYAVRVGSLSYFIFAYALWQLIVFLRLSRAGQVFATETTVRLRAFGRWLVVAAISGIVLPIAAIVIHEFILAPEVSHVVSPIRVSLFPGVFVIAVATLVMMICRVIDEGRRLRNELDEII